MGHHPQTRCSPSEFLWSIYFEIAIAPPGLNQAKLGALCLPNVIQGELVLLGSNDCHGSVNDKILAD